MLHGTDVESGSGAAQVLLCQGIQRLQDRPEQFLACIEQVLSVCLTQGDRLHAVGNHRGGLCIQEVLHGIFIGDSRSGTEGTVDDTVGRCLLLPLPDILLEDLGFIGNVHAGDRLDEAGSQLSSGIADLPRGSRCFKNFFQFTDPLQVPLPCILIGQPGSQEFRVTEPIHHPAVYKPPGILRGSNTSLLDISLQSIGVRIGSDGEEGIVHLQEQEAFLSIQIFHKICSLVVMVVDRRGEGLAEVELHDDLLAGNSVDRVDLVEHGFVVGYIEGIGIFAAEHGGVGIAYLIA